MSSKSIVPQGKKTRASSARRIKASIRAQEAVRLRLAGASLPQIAKQLVYKSDSGVYKAIRRYLNETADRYSGDIELARTQEEERLNSYLLSVAPQAQQGDVAAVNTSIRISESRRALLGLDAPKQLEARIRLDVFHWNEMLKLFLEVYREFHGDSSQAEAFLTAIDQRGQERFAGHTV